MSYTPGKTLQKAQVQAVNSSPLSTLLSYTTTISMPGATVGLNAVIVLPMSDPGALVNAQAWVSAQDTVTLRITNLGLVSLTSGISWLLILVSSN